ncbi:DUF5335 family protein [Aliiglaciecola sp. LCG003]|uniref:DUF5335 family protein n=1 Tax=Aliiglaciecola sp. LCG003 TaxID=3053655 RepID=UPI0025736641|nr:DUF5335 family protein [Aliiglaciecola sp. LCG003]WJG09177.1 DUF5335 family protein [Aliiglaciecola sp. LCG003]
MTTNKIEATQWSDYFNQLSKEFSGRKIEIEVDSLELGSQVQSKSLLLNGITFDSKDNALQIMTKNLVHVIQQPSAIYVESDGEILFHIGVLSEDGTEQIIKFLAPLALTHMK